MKRMAILCGLFVIFFTVSSSWAESVTMLQYFFLTKKVLPETEAVSIFIPSALVEDEKPKIALAAAKMGLKVFIHPVDNADEASLNLKQLKENSVLLVYDSPELNSAPVRNRILATCNAGNILVISSSRSYLDGGALLGVWKGEDGKIKLTLNLKKSPALSSRFNDFRLQQIGADEVIR